MNHTAALFEFKDVSLLSGSSTILNGINFKVGKGEFLAILGVSGAGKSSLLRMFNALSSPSTGQVLYRGQALEGDMRTLRENVGFLFQNPAVFDASVRDSLKIAGRWNPRIAGLLDHELSEILEEVGLDGISLSTNSKDLSGGEQQRLSLATMLLNHPQVLLLDEPTASLDQKSAIRIMTLIKNLRETHRLTIIAVSHDHTLMDRYADRAIVLSRGRLLGDGNIDALARAGLLEEAGLMEVDTT